MEKKKCDVKRLIDFLIDVETIIDDLVKKPKGYVLKKIIDNKKLTADMRKAWDEARERLKSTRRKIRRILINQDFKDYYARLEDVGLTGSQLKFKLALFNYFKKAFYSQKTLNFLSRLLGLINSILGSLTAVFPPIEVVKEFKESIEQIVKMK